MSSLSLSQMEDLKIINGISKMKLEKEKEKEKEESYKEAGV